MNFEFIKAAMLDFSDDASQFVYSYKCPTYSEECRNESDSDAKGWFFFSLIMIGDLLPDFANGIKLLILSGKQILRLNTRIRLFIGGSCLYFVSSLTVFASTVYNIAIARSNPEIVGWTSAYFFAPHFIF